MRAKSALVAALLAGLAAPAGAQTPPGAAACSGCHAPARLASPVPPVAGRDPKEIVAAMQEFRSGQRAATVMDRIAKGFSDDEVQAIAAWLATQR
jgi:cytochrome subunit of sulfide dehydrogenase